jgi:hypothetical protein
MPTFLQKLTLVATTVACAPGILALAQLSSEARSTSESKMSVNVSSTTSTTTTTPVPVNLGQNIVTIVLVLGVTIAITVAFLLYKTIPKCRRGEIKFGKIEFDWRAELLNQTPKKEKARRAEEKARRDAERAEGRYGDVDEGGVLNQADHQPRVEMDEVSEPVADTYNGRHMHGDDDAHVTFPRDARE